MNKLPLLSFLFLAMIRLESSPFINLGFELGSTNSSQVETKQYPVHPGPPSTLTLGTGPVKDLLPGWRVVEPPQEVQKMAIGSGFYGSQPSQFPPHAALLDRQEYWWQSSTIPFDGKFALALEAVFGNVWVTQTGDVPQNAKLLSAPSFQNYVSGSAFSFLIDGTVYPPTPHPSTSPTNFTLDVSKWAGKTIELGIKLPYETVAVVDSLVFIADADGPYTITKAPSVTGEPERVVIGFAIVPTHDYFVEFRDILDASAAWQMLPGAPHNLGSAVDTSTNSQRFYRVRSVEKALQ